MSRFLRILSMIALYGALSIAVAACDDADKNNAQTQTPDAVSPMAQPTGDNSRNALDWAGVYKGIIPCADCSGIEKVVSLESGGTYTMLSRYQDKDKTVSTEKGVFTWDDTGGIITLAQKPDPVKFRVGENTLTMLDLSGNKITGDLAAHYVLQKQDDPTLTETYWKLVELMGKPVTPSANEAHIILKNDDSRVIGSGGCNRITGGYELGEHGRLRFTQMAGTMIACLDGMETEHHFLETLGRADSYVISNGRLQLNRARMAPLAVFEAVYLY